MIQNLVVKRLTDLHDVGSRSKLKTRISSASLALAAVFFLPILHIGVIYYLWIPEKPSVNREHCSCDCFDTVFRGRYEWPPSAYKHLYFNSTGSSSFIWLVVIIGVILGYEAVSFVFRCVLSGSYRIPFLVLFLLSVYPHYYGWWNFINYFNEDFYYQFYHQLFFTVTEVISTGAVLSLLPSSTPFTPAILLVILSINTVHIVIGGLDQFIVNVLEGEGQVFEAVRDLGLMVPDLFHVFVAYFELAAIAHQKRTQIYRLFYREELTAAVILGIVFTILGKNL